MQMDDESVVKVDDIQLSELGNSATCLFYWRIALACISLNDFFLFRVDKVVESDIPANDSSDNGNNLDRKPVFPWLKVCFVPKPCLAAERENPETPTPLSTK